GAREGDRRAAQRGGAQGRRLRGDRRGGRGAAGPARPDRGGHRRRAARPLRQAARADRGRRGDAQGGALPRLPDRPVDRRSQRQPGGRSRRGRAVRGVPPDPDPHPRVRSVSAVAGARFVVEADGAARGNPGPAGYGAVVKDAEGRVLAETAEAIGVATNNVAEYRGLIAGLRALLGLGAEGEPVEVRMDSRLVIEQMSGRWKVKHEGLRPLAAEAAGLARRFRVTWTWVPREQNGHADRLANEAVDAAERGERWAPSGGPRAEAAAPGAPPGPDAPPAPRSPAGPEPPSAAGVPTGPEAPPAPGAPPASEAPPAPGATAEPRDTGAAPAWETGPRAAAGDRAPRPVRTATSLLLIRHGET